LRGDVQKPIVPAQPKAPEPIPEPKPFDYLLDGLRGKYDVDKTCTKGDVDIFDVKKDKAIVARVYLWNDGSHRAGIQTKSGKKSVVIDSIKAAETVIADIG
jgi:hypothetical protein